jgi:hypothetical protein
MTKIVEENTSRDHYKATLENGSLVMKPHCTCGNILDEDYFCDKCDRKCHCHQIICDTETTLKMVESYMKKSSRFSAFKVKLADEN